MGVTLYVRDVPEELRDRVRQRAVASRQSVSSFLLDVIEREMRLPTLDAWLGGLDGLPKVADVATDEIVGAVREIRELS